MKKNIKIIVVSAYLYMFLHCLGWFIIMNLNGQKNWHSVFTKVYIIVFLPLNLINYIQVKLIWGTINIFDAKFIFNIFIDWLIMSFISTSLILLLMYTIHKVANNIKLKLKK